ncbi:MAG: hypothetical protein ACJA0H_001967 [Francisellaceae bacterium]|jgi:hypothetical protein
MHILFLSTSINNFSYGKAILETLLLLSLIVTQGCGSGGSVNNDGGVIIDTGSTQISWSGPSSRENGNPLPIGEIAGYYIQYQEIGKSTYNHEFIDDATKVIFILSGIPSGDYQIQVATVDTDGLMSSFSNPIDITI